jgi:hypothetical protein
VLHRWMLSRSTATISSRVCETRSRTGRKKRLTAQPRKKEVRERARTAPATNSFSMRGAVQRRRRRRRRWRSRRSLLTLRASLRKGPP